MFAARRKVSPLPADRVGWLGFAAAPTFALMACFHAIGGPGAEICSVTAFPLPIGDMALMYLLMSLFHLSPWIRHWSAPSRHRASPDTRTEGD